MRDPFSAPVDFNNENHRAGNELTRTNMPLSVGDYGLQNGDATTFAVNTDTLVRSFILASTPGCIPPE
jgi:FtsP/CotA-like multicopper oxidase with cupredoxin domain